MSRIIHRIVVIGSGTMGGGIAAHFANAGIPVHLLDISQQVVTAGFERMKKSKPPAFFTPDVAELVTIGNLAEHDSRIAEGDWIIEAIIEELGPKRDLVARIDRLRKPGSIVSSNTSGLPIAKIADGVSADFKAHFLGTHFFNPPRYMKLLEVIPTADTRPDIVGFVRDFAARRLGKGVVICKDTPNFIANRIASIGGATLLDFVLRHGYTIEETDAIAGPLIGRPKTAAFRLQDLVGLDVSSSVAANLYGLIPHDESREILRSSRVEELRKAQMDRGRLGDKTGQGYYKKDSKSIQTLDLQTGQYRERREPEIPSIAQAMKIKDLPERVKFVLAQDDKAGALARHVIYNTLGYAARRIPEITDDFANVDRALRWGFSHEMGPFELWDALGVRETAAAMERYGVAVPQWAKERERFYEPPAARPEVNDGILCLDSLDKLAEALDELERGEWIGMVITHDGADFCANADLHVPQDALTRICQSAKPVVAAIFGRTLGSGAEVAMAAARIVAAAETYIGGVRSSKELIRRVVSPPMKKNPGLDPLPFVQSVLQTIATGRVSTSAEDARAIGFLGPADRVVMNRDDLLAEAKHEVRDMVADGYAPPPREKSYYAAGRDVYAALRAGIYQLQQGAYISEADAARTAHIAKIVAAGELSSPQWVDEEFFAR
jgi:3-hydroxyacyl-CoA dehydrogenase